MSEAGSLAEGRVAASLARMDALAQAVDGWSTRRATADPRGRYATQLATVSTVLRRALDAVRTTVPPAGTGLSETYEACWLTDRRTTWVERVWRYFASRFDQRDGGGPTADCLRAADEALWSCWRPCFSSSPGDGRPELPGPVPLPFLDAVHAPEAFPVGLVPADLSAAHADVPFVKEHLASMPVPTVRVPAAAVTEPWLLALVAHESAHHVQHDARMVEWFRTLVVDIARDTGGTDDDVSRWRDWSTEVFADVASAAILGPWALWPVAELEMRGGDGMRQRRASYPSAVTRLHLLRHAIDAFGLDGATAWVSLPATIAGGLTAGDDEAADLRVAEAVAVGATSPAPAGLGLARWFDLRRQDFGPDGPVESWRRRFVDDELYDPGPSLLGPRSLLAGIVAAAADARAADPGTGRRVMATLRSDAVHAFAALAVPGTRPSPSPADVAAAVDVADTFSAWLADASASELDAADASLLRREGTAR